MRTIALTLSILIAGAPVAAQQPAAPPPLPTAAEIAALEAEIAAAEAAVREAEAAVQAAETEERIAAAEARAEAAEAEAARVAAEAARIVEEAESLGVAPPVIRTFGQRFQPEPRRRSGVRTAIGGIMAGFGGLFTVAAADNFANGYTDNGTAALVLGLPPLILGLALATAWSDVPDTRSVSIAVSPDGFRASKTFGW